MFDLSIRQNLFEGVIDRINMRESIELTIQSLQTYGERFEH